MKKIILFFAFLFGIMMGYAQSGSTITSQPKSTAVCNGQTATLSITATGFGTIFYRWQKFDPFFGGYFDLPTTNPAYSGVTTNTLSINTAGNFGAGTYHCRTTIDYDVFSNIATVTINAVPNTPKSGGGSGCSGTSITIIATGGVNGQYRWYTSLTGVTAIAGVVNDSYATPTLSVTTAYYVAVNNGLCESSRTSAIASIIVPPDPPAASGGNAGCGTNTVVLKASGAKEGGFKWYTTASGGTSISSSSILTTTITSTTTFYVAIDTGTCESGRTSVIANFKTTCVPPAIDTKQIDTKIGGIATLNLMPLIKTAKNSILDLASLVIVKYPSSGGRASISPTGILTIDYTGLKFSGTENLTISACDTQGNCAQQVFRVDVGGEVVVYNALSPNDDQKNDFLYLQFIDVLSPKNQVSIFNRWGDEVFSIADYNNDTRKFTGFTNEGGKLPVGTYFYKITLLGTGKAMSGFIELKY
jgi:gliding motility-associated-like protein